MNPASPSACHRDAPATVEIFPGGVDEAVVLGEQQPEIGKQAQTGKRTILNFRLEAGIGAVGTFLIGIALFGDAATVARFVCVGLIVGGIIGLKAATK